MANRVALVASWIPLPSRGHGPATHNLAIGYLQAFAQQALPSLQVHRCDFPLPLGHTSLPDNAVDTILSNDPQLIGFSCYCWDRDAFRKTIEQIKKRSASTRIVVGGPTATFEGHHLIDSTPGIDVLVRGEGEETFLDLLSTDDSALSTVPGILYRDGDCVRQTPARPLAADLSRYPSPYLAGAMEPAHDQLTLEWSRGCVFRCRHCAWKNFLGPVRFASPSAVADELHWALQQRYEHAFVLDSAINFNSEHLDTLTRTIAREVPFGRLLFTYFLSQQHYHTDQIASLQRIAAHEIWLGLESIHTPALRALGRPPFDRAKFEHMVDDLSRLGPLCISIMLGIPGDSIDGFRRTVDYVAELAATRPNAIKAVRVFWTIVPPGSFFADHAAELGVELPSMGMPYILGCHSMPSHDLLQGFHFLQHHAARALFVWDDPSPESYDPVQRVFRQDRPSITPAAPCLSTERLASLAPCWRLEASWPGGWVVRQCELHDGWPTISLQRQGAGLRLQVRIHQPGAPSFVHTREFDILWLHPTWGDAPLPAAEEMRRLALFLGRQLHNSEP